MKHKVVALALLICGFSRAQQGGYSQLSSVKNESHRCQLIKVNEPDVVTFMQSLGLKSSAFALQIIDEYTEGKFWFMDNVNSSDGQLVMISKTKIKKLNCESCFSFTPKHILFESVSLQIFSSTQQSRKVTLQFLDETDRTTSQKAVLLEANCERVNR